MKRVIFSRLLALVLVLVTAVSLSACAGKTEQNALSLENGWYGASDAVDNANKYSKGFTDKDAEPKMLSELATESDSAVFFSNTFNTALNVKGGKKVVLDVYDAKGDITLWLNGKEIAAEAFEAGRASFDVTKQIKNSGKNSLVVMAASHGESELVSPGSRIEIAVHAPVYVEDAYTVSDMENGILKVFAVVNNTTAKEQDMQLKADIASMDNNIVSANYVQAVTVPAGQSTVEFAFDGADLIPWSNENPFLYMLTINLGEEVYSDYIGYKTFEMGSEGSFLINGNPILIKAADITEDETYAKNLYEILNYVKIAGFNTVHVNDGVATARLLEHCDKLGLFVYEGEAENGAELAKRDRSHVSLCMADGNLSAWKESGAAVAVVTETGIANSLGEEVKLDIVEANITSAMGEAAVKELKISDNSFIKSVGISGAKDNAVDISKAKEWYEAFGIDAVMAMGEINDVINNFNVKDNSILLDYIRNNKISGLCFTTDISREKTDLTEIIDDDLNDLRFTVLTDKSNAFDTDSLKVKVNLSNYGVLTGGSYDVIVRITGQGVNPYKKTVTIEIDPEKTIQKVLEETIPLTGYASGEYIVSAEFYKNAHATCGEKSILVMNKADLPKLSGKVYVLDVNSGLTSLMEAQGATVEKFTGSQKGVIIIGEGCKDAALMEKAYANGTKVVVLGAQNKETLPVEGTVTQNEEQVFVLHKSALTEKASNTNVLYEVGVGGYIVGDSRFETSLEAVRAMSAFNVNADGSVNAGDMFAMYEDKYVISTLAIEDNITNPYAAYMLLSAIK